MKKREMGRGVRLLWTAGLLLVMLIVGLTMFAILVRTSHAQGPDTAPGGWQLFFPSYPSPNERLGFGLAGNVSSLTAYDVAQLNAGWYTNWGASLNPPRPAGLVYVQVVRLNGPFRSCLRSCDSYKPTCTGIIDYSNCRSDYPPDPDAVGVSPNRDTIQQIAQANPGSVWLIGNEPDRIIYMDDVCPDEYAMVYHELYHLIKEADPTAKVAVGGIVQATPIRLQYLSIVMCVYEHTYGTKLPADLWNVHAFILNEEAGGWGCDLPPGMVTPSLAQRRNVWDCDDMDIFKQQIHDFRQWMADQGEREKPLIISEYGILMPSWLCDGDETYYHPYCGYKPSGKPNGRPYDYPRVTAFMQATFDYFLGIDPDGIDPTLGYPADGNRLVQAWNWYSLNEDWMYNGNLFRSGNKQITQLGQDFAAYTAPLIVPYKDLLPWALSFEHIPDLLAGAPVTVTTSSQVFNMGNDEVTEDVLVRFWDGDPNNGGTQLGGDQMVSNVPSRYEGAPTAAVTWTTVATRVHDIYVEVNPEQSVTETTYANNTISATLDFKSDLAARAITFDPPHPLLEDGQAVTVTISGQVQNIGHLAAVSVTVSFWDGDPDGGGTQIGSDLIAPNPADPLGRDEVAMAQVTWTTGVSGTHQIYMRVDPDDDVGEINEDNNQMIETIWVAADRIFLPIILKGSADVSSASVTTGSRHFLKTKLPSPTPTP